MRSPGEAQQNSIRALAVDHFAQVAPSSENALTQGRLSWRRRGKLGTGAG